MNRLREFLKIRPGEGRMAALLVGLMLFTSAGGAIGGNATEALFYKRFGTDLLPTMYIILGLVSFITALAITVLLGRVQRQRLFVLLPFVIGFSLIAERLIIPLDLKWFFAVMWLGMNVFGSLQGLLTWGLAGAACDTRQAKRLFPLFSAGGILGTVLGGLATQPLAEWLHSENLLLIWAGALFVTFILGPALIGPTQIRAPAAPTDPHLSGVIKEMQGGYSFVRRSRIMQWISYSAILFSVCFFSLALPFSRGATAQFPDADRLAGFLGLFQSLNTTAALLASLFLANRLYARFGIMPMLLLFPVIYLVGFGVLSISAPFLLLVGVRFAQMAWMEGIANPAWQAIFNVVPPERRDQVRAFVSGGPEQAGTFIAGLILLVGEQALRPQQLYLIGLAAAALLVYIIWRASQAYGGALVEALRAGQPQLFFSEEQPFGGFVTDAAAVNVALQSLKDAEPAVRRVAAEIIGNLPSPETAAALVRALTDSDAMVRAAALRGLARSGAAFALTEMAACLNDPDLEVRLEAIDAVSHLPGPASISQRIESLLQDPDPLVQVKAAMALIRMEDNPAARQKLHQMAADPNPQVQVPALKALGELQDEAGFSLAASALEDGPSQVKESAAAALVAIQPGRAVPLLVARLNETNTAVRRAVARALSGSGPAGVEALVEALANPSYADGALMALELLPTPPAAGPLRSHAQAAARDALHYYRLAMSLSSNRSNLSPSDGGRCQLLVDSLHDKAQRSALIALRTVGLLKNRATVSVAVDNLSSPQAGQRANALETLESIGEREIIQPLLAVWESSEAAAPPLPEHWLVDLLHDPYSWLRACAALVAEDHSSPEIRQTLQEMAQADPDFFVREVAEKALPGGNQMDSLATLSVMERILFLRRVSMFAGLPPADLKQLAAIMREVVFMDRELLTRQGDPGDELFIIVSGQVSVEATAEGQKEARQVARRLPGDYVGEMAIISQEPRAASLVAVGAVRTLCINQKQFESILRERPEISLAVMQMLCQRLREATAQPAMLTV